MRGQWRPKGGQGETKDSVREAKTRPREANGEANVGQRDPKKQSSRSRVVCVGQAKPTYEAKGDSWHAFSVSLPG